MEEPNYNSQHLDDEVNKPDAKKALYGGELIAIVDQKAGGIIGYGIGKEHADDIVAKLNDYDRIKIILQASGMWDELKKES